MKMKHKSEPYKINLEVQFKFRPDMLEINISDSYLIKENEEIDYDLDRDFKKQILQAVSKLFRIVHLGHKYRKIYLL